MMIRTLLSLVLLATTTLPGFAQEHTTLSTILDQAVELEPLETVMVSVNGAVIAEHGYGDHKVNDQTNIKSASKTVISALVGMAIDRGMIEGVDQPIADFLREDFPENADPRLEDITIGDLLSMQAGLAPTSGANYGRWVASRNWVRNALEQEFETDPGGRMLYSTGSTHLLSAILTRASGESTLQLAREWFAAVDDFAIGGWARDRQGIYLGGNEMAMSARSLLAFGEVYRNGGLTPDGERVLSADWITQSWVGRTNSRFTGDGYGYGWYLRRIGDEYVRFAWGYGGQMLYIVPSLELTVVMTSDEHSPAASTGHRDDLHELLAEIIRAVRDGVASAPAIASPPGGR